SGPYTSVTRPRGIPPTPIAASRLIAPVEIDSTRMRGASGPIFMMDPLPQLFSICAMARLRAFLRSSCTVVDTAMSPPVVCREHAWLRVGCNLILDTDPPETRRNYEPTRQKSTRQSAISAESVECLCVFHMPDFHMFTPHQHTNNVDPVFHTGRPMANY